MPRPVSPHLVAPDQYTLLAAVARDWSAIRGLTVAEQPALTDAAAALLAEFAASSPRTSGGVTGGGAALRGLLAWLGAQAAFHERDLRALAARSNAPSTQRLLHFLHQRGLLELDQPDRPP